MRTLLFTVMTMGGFVLVMEFVLIDTARLKQRVDASERPVEIQFQTDDGESYRTKVLPRILPDLAREEAGQGVPSGQIAALIDLYPKDPLRALSGLERVGGASAAAGMWRLFQMERDAGRQRMIVQALGRMKGPIATAALRRIASAKASSEVRDAALRELDRQ
ncbi:MAG: hypothetical protein CMJ83_05770 [Planctomycetes bacterium]|nr:hypothetical protein [Planctomycetota bacterium]